MPEPTPRRLAMQRRRSALPPRPTYEGAPAELDSHEAGSTQRLSRPARLVEREAPYMVDELKRIALVSATCIGLLVLLGSVLAGWLWEGRRARG